jgi:hypothetical protein
MRRFPYAIYFTCGGEVIDVLAILHQHRGDAPGRVRRRE